MRVEQQNHRLIIHDGRSECWIDPWGKDSLRVRIDRKSTRLNSSHVAYLVCRLLLEKRQGVWKKRR